MLFRREPILASAVPPDSRRVHGSPHTAFWCCPNVAVLHGKERKRIARTTMSRLTDFRWPSRAKFARSPRRACRRWVKREQRLSAELPQMCGGCLHGQVSLLGKPHVHGTWWVTISRPAFPYPVSRHYGVTRINLNEVWLQARGYTAIDRKSLTIWQRIVFRTSKILEKYYERETHVQ